MFICTAVVSPDCGIGREDLKPCLSWIWKSDNVILIKWPARHERSLSLLWGMLVILTNATTNRLLLKQWLQRTQSPDMAVITSVIFSLHKCKIHKKKHLLEYCFNRATSFGFWRLHPQQSAVYSISLWCLSDHTCQTQSHTALGLFVCFSLGGIFTVCRMTQNHPCPVPP